MIAPPRQYLHVARQIVRRLHVYFAQLIEWQSESAIYQCVVKPEGDFDGFDCVWLVAGVQYNAEGVVSYEPSPDMLRVRAPENARPIVILPGINKKQICLVWSSSDVCKPLSHQPWYFVFILQGFGNNSNDYIAPFGSDKLQDSLVNSLKVSLTSAFEEQQ